MARGGLQVGAAVGKAIAENIHHFFPQGLYDSSRFHQDDSDDDDQQLQQQAAGVPGSRAGAAAAVDGSPGEAVVPLPPPRKTRVKTAEFIKSSVNVEQCPAARYPEFAVIGRSNVGKSSLINLLTGRSSLAMVSKTPGEEGSGAEVEAEWLEACAQLLDMLGAGALVLQHSSRSRSRSWSLLICWPTHTPTTRPTSHRRHHHPAHPCNPPALRPDQARRAASTIF